MCYCAQHWAASRVARFSNTVLYLYRRPEENILDLSFVDDVTWVITRVNFDKMTDKLEQCAERELQRAN
jgi:hypothetical protein